MDKKTITAMKKVFDDIMHTTEDGTKNNPREFPYHLGFHTH